MTTHRIRKHEHTPPSDGSVAEAIELAVARLKNVFGGQLAEVWLYGSRANGSHRPDSDVDLLLVLHEHLPNHEVFRLITSVQVPIWLSHRVLIEGHPTTMEKLTHSSDDFHHFVRLEGYRIDG